jgi:HK97 gp10 family phage protein
MSVKGPESVSSLRVSEGRRIMRVENWSPGTITAEIEKRAMDRLQRAGEIVAEKARSKVPVGKDRPPYKNGKDWTERKAGALRDSIRVVRLSGDPKLDVRVYAGSRIVYYARWVEMGSVHNNNPLKPYLRPALNESKSEIKNLVENG